MANKALSKCWRAKKKKHLCVIVLLTIGDADNELSQKDVEQIIGEICESSGCDRRRRGSIRRYGKRGKTDNNARDCQLDSKDID